MQKVGAHALPWRDWFRDIVKSASSSALSGGNDPRINAADKPGTNEHSVSVTQPPPSCIPLNPRNTSCLATRLTHSITLIFHNDHGLPELYKHDQT